MTVTWEDVQKVYPKRSLEKLREDISGWHVEGKDDEETVLAGLIFVVISQGSRYGWSNRDQRFYLTQEPSFWPFAQGEILLTFGGGREPFGKGRKPSKWNVAEKEFATYDEAKAFSDTVTSVMPIFYGDAEDADWVRKEYGHEQLPEAALRSVEHQLYALDEDYD